MSRAIVRAGVLAWLSSHVTGIGTVYPAPPATIPASAFYASGASGQRTGCIAVFDIYREVEERKALGGATSGWKRIDYQVGIQLFFRSTAPATLGGDAALQAMDAFDAVVENLKARIRADRTAGGTVWQWGEAGFQAEYGEMVQEGDRMEMWAQVLTEITEWIQS